MSKTIYIADSVFTGAKMLMHHAIVVNNDIIESVVPISAVENEKEIIDFGEAVIAPAFIDIQLYGAHGRLLAVYPDAKTVGEIYDYCKKGGAAYCMPTVATNPYETIFKCIDAIRSYWQQGGKGVLGLHVEGPWISKTKRGAHREEWIFSPTFEEVNELLKYGKDVIKIITLAPEVCSKEVLGLIHSNNIIVSAGHSNATYQEAMQSFDEGIHTATHLFNAMSALQHRAPGMVGAVFNHPRVLCSMVPDGHHVDFAVIRIAKKIMGERLFVITDAVTETTEGYYKHKFEGDKYTSNGILSGSALTMSKAAYNLVHHAGISFEEALRMCSLYPACALKIDDRFGMIEAGRKANFVVLSNEMNVLTVL